MLGVLYEVETNVGDYGFGGRNLTSPEKVLSGIELVNVVNDRPTGKRIGKGRLHPVRAARNIPTLVINFFL